jgi:hypothetical protein
MKITVSKLNQIVSEEIKKELEQEELFEGLKQNIAALFAGALMSMGYGAANTAEAEPVKVTVKNVKDGSTRSIVVDDLGANASEVRDVMNDLLDSRYGPGKFVTVGVKPTSGADLGSDAGSVKPSAPAKKAGRGEVLKVDGNVVTVKVPVRGGSMGLESAQMDARAMAVDAVRGRDVGGSRVSSGKASTVSSEVKDGFLIMKVKVGG